MANIENCFTKSKVDNTADSGWLQRLVRPSVSTQLPAICIVWVHRNRDASAAAPACTILFAVQPPPYRTTSAPPWQRVAMRFVFLALPVVVLFVVFTRPPVRPPPFLL